MLIKNIEVLFILLPIILFVYTTDMNLNKIIGMAIILLSLAPLMYNRHLDLFVGAEVFKKLLTLEFMRKWHKVIKNFCVDFAKYIIKKAAPDDNEND
jgi:hypothetical protein